DLHGRQAADFEDARREDLHLAERRAEPRRHDADDLPRETVERDVLADDLVASAEARLPELVADDADSRTVWGVLALREVAAAGRQDAERRKERRADALRVQLLRLTVARQREVVEGGDAERRKRLCVRA